MRDGDDTRTLDERMGAKPPRRGAEPFEARSASRGAQRSVALGCSVDLGVRREGRGSWAQSDWRRWRDLREASDPIAAL